MIENNQTKSKKTTTTKTKGGARQGAGRKEGSLTKRTREIAEIAVNQGITPLEVMIRTMQEILDEATNQDHQDAAVMAENRIKLLNMAANIAKHAAPYMHPRLSAIEHTGKDGAPLQSGVLVVPSAMSVDEWEQAAQTKP
ncbi:hypothetical protein [Polynucleobacter antarcticus]|uniref:Uncharacterized protein n=1 Tax=Polynucleobacter antarcticus TaxID=1743162 RepID=A0A6M9PV55_9BURK|nr:hypothetical protein [Polynucleobacter antarcticus]QKM62665.1 hypothetical protein DCO16_06105 [Polynucleobacter antarcticus]